MQVNSTAATSAYARAMQTASTRDDGVADSISRSAGNSGGGFGDMVSQAVINAIGTGHRAEAMAAQGMSGGGDMTQVVTAVSQAQLALQTTTVVRDRMVQAYQDVMRMSI